MDEIDRILEIHRPKEACFGNSFLDHNHPLWPFSKSAWDNHKSRSCVHVKKLFHLKTIEQRQQLLGHYLLLQLETRELH